MYTLLDYGVEKKLFDFCTKLDLSHWVYDLERERLYTVTDKNRNLYIGCTKTNEQKVLTIPDFRTGTLEFLSNKRVLALLSQHRDKICYFDIENLKSLFITTHKTSKMDTKLAAKGQKIAISSDRKDIIIALSDRCLVIKIPVCIGEINMYERYRILRCTNYPKELHDSIGFFYWL